MTLKQRYMWEGDNIVVVAQSNTGKENDSSVMMVGGELITGWETKGGPGSGHHGHAGRPGQRGGSVPTSVPIDHSGIPSRLLNEFDGGAGPAIQYHGTSNRASTLEEARDVYLVTDSDEARGYARDLHRMGLPPRGGVQKRELLAVRRKPGAAVDVSVTVDEAIMKGDDPDDLLTKLADRYRRSGEFRYIYFTHPSFSGEGQQDVFISLYPDEDLVVSRSQSVKTNGGI